MLRIIKSMYNDVKSCVLTDIFENKQGVLQGDILSHVLFSQFLEDLETHFQEKQINIFLLLIADDLAIINETFTNGPQKHLDKLHTYCERWDLTVNIE